MEIKPQGIVSLHKDTVTMLYSESKETILFYLLLLTGETEENIKLSLNLDDESLRSISAYLAKKNLITLDRVVKSSSKKTYMDKLREECEKYLNEVHHTSETLDKIAKGKLIMYFYSELTGKVFTSDSIELKIQKKQEQGTFQQLIECIWRNHHNAFCNGIGWNGSTGGWVWDLAFLARVDTAKSQPLEKSLQRRLDIPVSDKAVEILSRFIRSVPTLQYIQTIPHTYENKQHTKDTASDEEILRKQREIKQSLGISITDL